MDTVRRIAGGKRGQGSPVGRPKKPNGSFGNNDSSSSDSDSDVEMKSAPPPRKTWGVVDDSTQEPDWRTRPPRVIPESEYLKFQRTGARPREYNEIDEQQEKKAFVLTTPEHPGEAIDPEYQAMPLWWANPPVVLSKKEIDKWLKNTYNERPPLEFDPAAAENKYQTTFCLVTNPTGHLSKDTAAPEYRKMPYWWANPPVRIVAGQSLDTTLPPPVYTFNVGAGQQSDAVKGLLPLVLVSDPHPRPVARPEYKLGIYPGCRWATETMGNRDLRREFETIDGHIRARRDDLKKWMTESQRKCHGPALADWSWDNVEDEEGGSPCVLLSHNPNVMANVQPQLPIDYYGPVYRPIMWALVKTGLLGQIDAELDLVNEAWVWRSFIPAQRYLLVCQRVTMAAGPLGTWPNTDEGTDEELSDGRRHCAK